jgi:anti-sigma factor (TIGR02949 family)
MNEASDRIGCEEAIRRLAAYLDGELVTADAGEVEVHLERCRSCFSRAEFERRLKERVREDLRMTSVPEEAEGRIRTLLEQLSHAS